MKDGRKDTIDFKFFTWVLLWNKNHKRDMLHLINSIKNKKVIITNNPRKLDIEELFK